MKPAPVDRDRPFAVPATRDDLPEIGGEGLLGELREVIEHAQNIADGTMDALDDRDHLAFNALPRFYVRALWHLREAQRLLEGADQ